jgi:peptidoglycan hydrolase-like protein with peptidoglycan-binding domain
MGMRARISASVGVGGVNSPPDTRLVQDLLNRAAAAGLAVDGDCGHHTRAAITRFQSESLPRPDGRVDPDGQTFRLLAAGARRKDGPARSDPATASGPRDGLSLAPLLSRGHGRYSYSQPERQYGSDAMLRLLQAVGNALYRAGFEVGVGDISFQQGGEMPPHKTHRAGKDVDLRPVRVGNSRGPSSIGESTYSRDGTRALVEVLLAESSVRRILFNDQEIDGVRSSPGHHNHLHVQLG